MNPATSLWCSRTSAPTIRRTISAPPTANAGNTTTKRRIQNQVSMLMEPPAGAHEFDPRAPLPHEWTLGLPSRDFEVHDHRGLARFAACISIRVLHICFENDGLAG